MPHGAESPTHALMGRFGNVMLVNGEPRYDAVGAGSGEVVRFFLTNASNARSSTSRSPARDEAGRRATSASSSARSWCSSVVHRAGRAVCRRRAIRTSGAVAVMNRVQALDHMIGVFRRRSTRSAWSRVAAARRSHRYASQFATLRRNADVVRRDRSVPPAVRASRRPRARLTMRTQESAAAVSNMLIGVNAAVDWNDGMPMMNWLATGQRSALDAARPGDGQGKHGTSTGGFASGRGREDPGVQRSRGESRHAASASPARPALPRRQPRRRGRHESGVEGHGDHPSGRDGGPAGRYVESRALDDPLPHCRASRRRDDGRVRGGSMSPAVIPSGGRRPEARNRCRPDRAPLYRDDCDSSPPPLRGSLGMTHFSQEQFHASNSSFRWRRPAVRRAARCPGVVSSRRRSGHMSPSTRPSSRSRMPASSTERARRRRMTRRSSSTVRNRGRRGAGRRAGPGRRAHDRSRGQDRDSGHHRPARSHVLRRHEVHGCRATHACSCRWV